MAWQCLAAKGPWLSFQGILQAGIATLCAWRWSSTMEGCPQPRPCVSTLAFGGVEGPKLGGAPLCLCAIPALWASSSSAQPPAHWCSTLPPPSTHGATCSPARSCLYLGRFRVQQAWPLCRLPLVGCLEDWRASSCKEIPSGFCCQLLKNMWMSGLVQFKLMLSSVHYISMCLEQRRHLKVRIALSPASPRPWCFLEWENSVASCSQFCFLSKFLVVRYLLAWDLMLGVVLPFRMLMLYLRTMNV